MTNYAAQDFLSLIHFETKLTVASGNIEVEEKQNSLLPGH